MRKALAIAAAIACVSSLGAQDAFKSVVDGAAAPDPIRTTAPAPAAAPAAPMPVIAPIPAA
ncbi:MAG: peptidase, partial [Planctomycetes bacterium]|nr:peptidase [Planctomycetota bacterium]